VWATSEFQLSEGGLEIFHDFGGDDIGIGKVGAVCEALVFEPEEVAVELSRFVRSSYVKGPARNCVAATAPSRSR